MYHLTTTTGLSTFPKLFIILQRILLSTLRYPTLPCLFTFEDLGGPGDRNRPPIHKKLIICRFQFEPLPVELSSVIWKSLSPKANPFYFLSLSFCFMSKYSNILSHTLCFFLCFLRSHSLFQTNLLRWSLSSPKFKWSSLLNLWKCFHFKTCKLLQ